MLKVRLAGKNPGISRFFLVVEIVESYLLTLFA